MNAFVDFYQESKALSAISVYINSIIKQGKMIARVSAIGLNAYFGKSVDLVIQAQKNNKYEG